MRIFICTLLMILNLAPFYLHSQNINRKSLNVTVYNINLGVIRDIREIEFKQGINEIKVTDVAQNIDPTSVHIKLNGNVLEQNFQYDLVSLDKILEKYIDKDIKITSKDGKLIEGILLSIGFNGSDRNIVLRSKDGGLQMIPNISEYTISVSALPEGFITKPTLVWTVNTNKSGKQDVELSYQTQNIQWHAEYVAVLNKDDTKMDFNSWVSISNNSGATYPNAKIKLVAGDVNIIQPSFNRIKTFSQDESLSAYGAPQQFQEKPFFDFHLYTLQRNATIANNETKQISLFEASNVSVTKKYLLKSSNYTYYQSDNKRKVSVVVEFENKEKNNLGMPLPMGKVRVYKSDGESLEFVGEDNLDHTPKDEKIKLKVGDAFDITAEEKELEQERISDKVTEHTYSVKINNRKDTDIVVEVVRNLGWNWKILDSNYKYEKQDSQNVIFKMPIKSNKEEELKFKVRYTL